MPVASDVSTPASSGKAFQKPLASPPSATAAAFPASLTGDDALGLIVDLEPLPLQSPSLSKLRDTAAVEASRTTDTWPLSSSFSTDLPAFPPIDDKWDDDVEERNRSSTATTNAIAEGTVVSPSTAGNPLSPISSSFVKPVASLASGPSASLDVGDASHPDETKFRAKMEGKAELNAEMVLNSGSRRVLSDGRLEIGHDGHRQQPPEVILLPATTTFPDNDNASDLADEVDTRRRHLPAIVPESTGEVVLASVRSEPGLPPNEGAPASGASLTPTTSSVRHDTEYPATNVENPSPVASEEATEKPRTIESGPPPCPPSHVIPLHAVRGGERGEGWPYAPEGWPETDDKWPWKVGKRIHISGYYKDRFLGLPKSLNGGRRAGATDFASKKSIVEYLRLNFPEVDSDNFFKSFVWRVRSVSSESSPAPAPNGSGSAKRPRPEEEEDEEEEEQDVEGSQLSKRPRLQQCKAGNRFCSLVTGVSVLLRDGEYLGLPCDVCCAEDGFCPECKCILCCKTVVPAEQNFIRCLSRPSGESRVCGHAAHLQCAVHAEMAGTLKKKGLDMEYLCRRCDNKTDLREIVTVLLEAFGNFAQRSRAEASLELSLELMRGTERAGSGAKVLELLVQSALRKIQNGDDIREVYRELKDQAKHQSLARTPSIVEELTQQPEASLDQWLQEGSPSSHPSPGTPSSFTSRLKSNPSVTSITRPRTQRQSGASRHRPANEAPDVDPSNAMPEVDSHFNDDSSNRSGLLSAGQKRSHPSHTGPSKFSSDLEAVSTAQVGVGASPLAKASQSAVREPPSQDANIASQSVERGSVSTSQKQKAQSSSSVRLSVPEDVCYTCGGSGSVQSPAEGSITSHDGEQENPISEDTDKVKRRRLDSRRDTIVRDRVDSGDDAPQTSTQNTDLDLDGFVNERTVHSDRTVDTGSFDPNTNVGALRDGEEGIRSTRASFSRDFVTTGVRRVSYVSERDEKAGEHRDEDSSHSPGITVGGRVGNGDDRPSASVLNDLHGGDLQDIRNIHARNLEDRRGRTRSDRRNGTKGSRLGRESQARTDDAPPNATKFGVNLDVTADECNQHAEEVLRQLKESQKEEFEFVKARLFAQKESILENHRLLDTARVACFNRQEVTSSVEVFDDLLLKLADQYGKTMKVKKKFQKMLDIAQGFGQASASLRRTFYERRDPDDD